MRSGPAVANGEVVESGNEMDHLGHSDGSPWTLRVLSNIAWLLPDFLIWSLNRPWVQGLVQRNDSPNPGGKLSRK